MNEPLSTGKGKTTPRQAWMKVLAKAALSDLECQVEGIDPWPTYHFLRSPDIGLVMVRGRAGGNGQPFNLGEMTVTRCAVKLNVDDLREESADIVGFGYVPGRSQRHAELAAVCDALLQHPDWSDRLHREVIAPLQQIRWERQVARQQETAATKVDFFTMPRGEE
ncbi:MAG: phosphonate C-P lyase system protein PhnG [Cyanobacteria bacterium P01_F01_bin.33]